MSKKLLLFLLVPAVLIIGGYLFLRISMKSAVEKDEEKTGEVMPAVDTLGGKKVAETDLRALFITRMKQLLKKSSNGLYDVTVGDMQVDVLASSLLLKKVVMKPDAPTRASLTKSGHLPNDIYSISFDELQVDGINLDDAITRKTMDYRLVKLVRPIITINHRRGEKQKVQKEEFSQRFLKEMNKLSIKKLVVEGGVVTVLNEAKKGRQRLNNVNVELTNILLDSVTRTQKDRFLFAESGTISFTNFSKPTKDGLYSLKVGKVTVRAPQQQVLLNNVSFTSPYNRSQFTSRQKLSKELYNLVLPTVTVSGVDWWTLLNEEEIIADAVTAKGGKLSIYLDRSLPPKNKMGNFPNQLVMKMPMRINIASLNLTGLDFSYSEYNPVSQQTGTVYMDKVNLSVNHISNSGGKGARPMIAKGSALFMHKVPIQSTFVFDMVAHRSGKFSAQIKAKGFDASLINSFTMPMGLMKMEKGQLHSAEASITGDQWKASGNVFIPYQDLKLSLLEKDKGEKELDKKSVTTFLANLFVIKKDNPQGGKDARRAQAAFTRIPEGGFFMLVWKTMLVGALKTIGAPEKIANKTVATAKDKQ